MPRSRKKLFRRAAAGFTLVELLLVTLLLPLVAFTAYSNFSSGFRLWKALNEDVLDEDLYLFEAKAARDFRDGLRTESLPFVGAPDAATFASIAPARKELGGDDAIVEVSYFYDGGTRSIMRRTRDRHEVFAEKPGRTQVSLAGVSGFSLSYFFYDATTQAYGWSEAWAGDPVESPEAVRFEFSFERNGRRKAASFTFPFPAGGRKQ